MPINYLNPSDESAKRLFSKPIQGEVIMLNRSTKENVKTIGTYGKEPGQLRIPLDVVINTKTKDVFVTNNRMSRIELFRQGGLSQ